MWPGCLIQFEDFKGHNALRILDRYRHRVPTFNDDIQGTAAVVLGGLLAGMRHLGTTWADQRVVVAGAGAAGTGIARLLCLAMVGDGMPSVDARRRIVFVDSQGLIRDGRPDLEPDKAELSMSAIDARAIGLAAAGDDHRHSPNLLDVVEALSPTILIGATGIGGSFNEDVIRAMSRGTPRPIVMPLSNPTLSSEAIPSDVLAWSEGRALVATGSPFPPVSIGHRTWEIGQANNVFIFPGVGLGAIVSESRELTDEMFLLAARTVADHVTPDRLEAGSLYPRVTALRTVSRAIAIDVAREAIRGGASPLPADTDVEGLVDASMWWPAYAPYRRVRGTDGPRDAGSRSEP